jgi:hypothetical protein
MKIFHNSQTKSKSDAGQPAATPWWGKSPSRRALRRSKAKSPMDELAQYDGLIANLGAQQTTTG